MDKIESTKGRLKQQERLEPTAPIEIIDDCLDFANQNRECWQYPFTVTTTGILKEYSEFKLSIHIHFRMRFGNGGRRSEDMCAVYFPLPRFCWAQHSFDPLGAYSLNVGDIWKHDNDHAVFVDVVEFMDDPQGIGLGIRWPSFIWLQILDRIRCFGPDWPEPFPNAGLIASRMDRADWELGFAACRRIARHNSELADQMIKGTAQVVNDVTDHQRNLWREWCSLRDNRMVFPFRLVLDNGSVNGISRGPQPGEHRFFQLIEVLLRSGDFGADPD